jgi:hypothetical protein
VVVPDSVARQLLHEAVPGLVEDLVLLADRVDDDPASLHCTTTRTGADVPGKETPASLSEGILGALSGILRALH